MATNPGQVNSRYNAKCEPDPEQIAYWYNDEAEISSYRLSQARYGEIHEGFAVLIFVTEHYSPKTQTKPDSPTRDQKPVLKLNFTKKFNTGIYPYSMMISTFFPFSEGEYSYKVSTSSQEWCGHTYTELLNKKKFELQVSSYFEGESKTVKIEKALLEDDIWSMIRLHPKNLPMGDIVMIPSFFSQRLLHQPGIGQPAHALLTTDGSNKTKTYSIKYRESDRTISVLFESEFPYNILGWHETYYSGWGKNRKKLTTSANLINTIKSDYWRKHNKEHAGLRKELGLDG